MEAIWHEMFRAAQAVQNPKKISDYIDAGGVAAAVLAASGKIYTGICAERNAVFNMSTNGDTEIKKVLAIMPDGKCGAPCGACREFMAQLMPNRYREIEIMLDYEKELILPLGAIMPEWWI